MENENKKELMRIFYKNKMFNKVAIGFLLVGIFLFAIGIIIQSRELPNALALEDVTQEDQYVKEDVYAITDYFATYSEDDIVKDKYYFNTGFTPDTKNPEYYNDEDGYEWVTISDINNGKINRPTISLISRDYVKNNFCKQVPKGCLLYSFKLSIGQTAITDRPLFTNEALASFIPSPNTNIRFLNYSSSLIEFNANTNIYGAKILNQQLINNAYIVFPPLNEQKQIADYLDRKCSKIDDIIEAKNKQLSTLDEYKKSLIYEYVTGKKEVPCV